MNMPNFFKICVFLFFHIFISCNSNRLKVDISDVPEQKIEVSRLDRDLFTFNTVKPENFHFSMVKKYGSFYSNFITNIVNVGDQRDSVNVVLKKFVTDKDILGSYHEIQQKYTDEKMLSLANQLSTAMRYFKFHFPNNPSPKRYVSFISGFNYNIAPQDSVLGFGLDMYLGEQSKYYSMLQWPKYKVHQMSEAYLVSDCMKGWIMYSFETNEPVNNLLSYMIRMGKIFYCLDAVLPELEDSVKIGYTKEQLKYCTNYEQNIWAYFTQKDRLFKTDMKELADYSSDGPFTAAISKECPPRIAAWVGWQIVRSYMNKNENVSLQELVNEKDINKILNQSKYKP